MKAGYRNVEFRAASVFQHQEFGSLAFNSNGLKALITTDTVIDMYHRGADTQFRQIPIAGIVQLSRFVPAPAL